MQKVFIEDNDLAKSIIVLITEASFKQVVTIDSLVINDLFFANSPINAIGVPFS
jgi:hypothetical protein